MNNEVVVSCAVTGAFAATGTEDTPCGPRCLITAFLVDIEDPGFEIEIDNKCVSYRGYHTFRLSFSGVKLVHRSDQTDQVWLSKLMQNQRDSAPSTESFVCVGPLGPDRILGEEGKGLERIWDGTSEIQRHIITRSILRSLGA